MKPTERGFLLLTSPLGDPLRKPLTPAAMRRLKQRLKENPVRDPYRHMIPEDLILLGYSPEQAMHILQLLSEEELLMQYMYPAVRQGIQVLTWITEGYPKSVLEALKAESPGTLWAKGNLSLLNMPCVSLVGSRELRPENAAFAKAVGQWAAEHGFALVSGNARGADRTAQNACLDAGGSVISVLADDLLSKHAPQGMLLLSEDGYELPFSAQRAISRNRVIHAMGKYTFVAQASFQKGGTWKGTVQNLRHGYSQVLCFDDGSAAATELIRQGAKPISMEELNTLD